MADDALTIPKESNAFPLPVNQELLERGEGRYKIFCTPCHGLQGDGNGMVAMRGMKHPPTYHQARLREAPNGYFYDVITNGFGAMLGYSAQIPPRDRWAIIAYCSTYPRAAGRSRSWDTSAPKDGLDISNSNSPGRSRPHQPGIEPVLPGCGGARCLGRTVGD